jgi:hypothetical protein
MLRLGSLTHKQTKLERLARDKRSSLLWKGVTYGLKKFYVLPFAAINSNIYDRVENLRHGRLIYSL